MRAAYGFAAVLVALLFAIAWTQLVVPSVASRRLPRHLTPASDDGPDAPSIDGTSQKPGRGSAAPTAAAAAAAATAPSAAVTANLTWEVTTEFPPAPSVVRATSEHTTTLPPRGVAASPSPPPGPGAGTGWNGLAMEVGTDPAQYVASHKFHLSPLEPLPRRWPMKQSKSKVVARFALQYPGFANVTAAKGNRTTGAAAAKRAWVDLGARVYDKGSTLWFIRYYPGATAKGWSAALFDVHDFRDKYPAKAREFFSGGFEFFASAAWVHDRGVEVKGLRMSHVKEKGKGDPQDAALAKGRPDPRSTWSVESVDLAAWLRARYTAEDFVVLKMDIEGGEWEVLAHLIDTGAIALVDELMLECHARVPGVPTLEVHQSCIDLANHVRKQGVAAHLWF